ncbi:glucose-6-phosphate dehydrogenase assembly protein OpcA [Haloglycomyces albus]|uniref:glucose-6-phosphate dehydrogenase assembly protein OpcA n=1 Tax=Haloglycomyces albus TaxID=526067 RepID=UPI00046D2672|nr:glucose-6-phosphate dehydrogenase assembly protein OpcA [Haloglycomyces albus]
MQLTDTSTGEIMDTLAEELHAVGGSSSLALNLIVLATENERSAIEEATRQAAQEHPYRLIMAIPRYPNNETPRIDAEVAIGESGGAAESIVMYLDGPVVRNLTSLILPMLAPDIPVVTWWLVDPVRFHLEEELKIFSDRRITYSALTPDPVDSLYRRSIGYKPGDTDICWTRITLWRSLIASALDGLGPCHVESVRLRADRQDPSAQLLAAWIGSRLNLETEVQDTEVTVNAPNLPAIAGVDLTLNDGQKIEIDRSPDGETVLRQAGLAKRTVTLQGRSLGQLVAEELRILEPDQTYRSVLDRFELDYQAQNRG